MEEESLKIRKVQGYFNTMLFRGLVEHYSLSNPEIIRYALKRMLANLSKPTSVNAIYNDLKSQGRKVDKNRLYDLTEMATEIFMFYRVNKWSKSLVNETAALPKYYFIDNGMRNAIVLPQSGDDGKLLENAVFMHLRRKMSPMQKITYFLDGYECDFVLQTDDHVQMLVQACWSFDEATLERELRGLKAASNATGCNDCLIVAIDDEDVIEYQGLSVKIAPAWKWLLA